MRGIISITTLVDSAKHGKRFKAFEIVKAIFRR